MGEQSCTPDCNAQKRLASGRIPSSNPPLLSTPSRAQQVGWQEYHPQGDQGPCAVPGRPGGSQGSNWRTLSQYNDTARGIARNHHGGRQEPCKPRKDVRVVFLVGRMVRNRAQSQFNRDAQDGAADRPDEGRTSEAKADPTNC